MFDKFPCFRIKRRSPNGQTSELEIRPSLLRWLLIFLVVLVFLIRGGDPGQIFQNLLHLRPIPSLPLSQRSADQIIAPRMPAIDPSGLSRPIVCRLPRLN
jgi:hypothetical protein